MTGPEVLDVARDAIVTLVLVSSPLMLVGLVVGVVISLFQALTQIQEMTLVFVPKILAIFIAMLVALPFMADVLHGQMTRLAARIIGGLARGYLARDFHPHGGLSGGQGIAYEGGRAEHAGFFLSGVSTATVLPPRSCGGRMWGWPRSEQEKSPAPTAFASPPAIATLAWRFNAEPNGPANGRVTRG